MNTTIDTSFYDEMTVEEKFEGLGVVHTEINCWICEGNHEL